MNQGRLSIRTVRKPPGKCLPSTPFIKVCSGMGRILSAESLRDSFFSRVGLERKSSRTVSPWRLGAVWIHQGHESTKDTKENDPRRGTKKFEGTRRDKNTKRNCASFADESTKTLRDPPSCPCWITFVSDPQNCENILSAANSNPAMVSCNPTSAAP